MKFLNDVSIQNKVITNVSGNSDTATKLATAKKITIQGDATGSVTFDGSKDVTLDVNVTNIPGNITYGTASPVNGVGTNGDIYFQYIP